MLGELVGGVVRLFFEFFFEMFGQFVFEAVFVPAGWAIAKLVTLGDWPPGPASEAQLTCCGFVGLAFWVGTIALLICLA